MKNVKFCRVNLDYIKYLYQFDSKVQYNANETDNYNRIRPYIGIVLDINGKNYFAPLKSPKNSHKTMKNNIHYIEMNGLGLIAFNNMIPIKDSELIYFDFNDENPKYKGLLQKQFIFCSKNKEAIEEKANKTYKAVAIKKVKFFCDISCNFNLLETKCSEYKSTQ